MTSDRGFVQNRTIESFRDTATPQVRDDCRFKLNHSSLAGFIGQLENHSSEKANINKTKDSSACENGKSKKSTDLKINSKTKTKEQLDQQRKEAIVRYEQRRLQRDESQFGDPYNTIFIAHLPHNITQEDLLKECSVYGKVHQIHIIRNDKNECRRKRKRPYAFVSFEEKSHSRMALTGLNNNSTESSSRSTSSRRVVDVERNRFLKNFLPTRLRKK